MRTKNFSVVLVILSFAIDLSLYAQRISAIEDLNEDVEKIWEVSVPLQIPDDRRIEYAVLKTGVAVLSVDDETINCYNFDGQLKWRAKGIRPKSFYRSLQTSANGEYLYLSYAIDEDTFISTIFNAEGKLLWSANYDSPFGVSPSGKYLIAGFDALDYSMPLTVLDWASGRVLWKVEANPNSYWRATAGENDKLAYTSGGRLKFFQLQDGKLLWDKEVEFDSRADASEVHMSRSGNRIAYGCFLSSNGDGRLRSDRKIISYVFDEDGNLLWNRVKPIIRGGSEGGRIIGISDGGRYIAMTAKFGLTLFDLTNKKEIWTISEAGLHSITAFTESVLAFYPRISPVSTKIIFLLKSGDIRNDYVLDQFVDFRRDGPGRFDASKNDATRIKAIVVKRNNSHVVFSKVHIRLEIFE